MLSATRQTNAIYHMCVDSKNKKNLELTGRECKVLITEAGNGVGL